MTYFIILLALFISTKCILGQVYTQPEQIHLSLGETPATMTVTWVTQSKTDDSFVQYNIEDEDTVKIVNASQEHFQDFGFKQRVIYIHRAVLPVLPKKTYQYVVGSRLGWSSRYSFESLPTDSNWSPRFIIYGDMGNRNARALPSVQLEADSRRVHVVFHVGDFAYNMNREDGLMADAFMRQIEPIAASIPYMTCVGNHEQSYNFSQYKRRFSMPGGDGEGIFYSFNVGPAHIIAISTELYAFADTYGYFPIKNQYEWLQKDLAEANSPANRTLRPWIIVMGHRPMYCSNKDDPGHCLDPYNYIRVGISAILDGKPPRLYPLEPLLYNEGVDVIFGAHEHSYERMWPVYYRQVCNGSESPYDNPPAPLHIITGSGGCEEGVDPFLRVPQPWSAAHSDDYGYTRMQILNNTHLHIEQVSVKNNKVIDELTLIHNRHHAGMYNCKPKMKGN